MKKKIKKHKTVWWRHKNIIESRSPKIDVGEGIYMYCNKKKLKIIEEMIKLCLVQK